MLRPTLFTLLVLGLTACTDNATFELPSSSEGPQSPINPGDGGVFEPGDPGAGDPTGGGDPLGGGGTTGGLPGGGGSGNTGGAAGAGGAGSGTNGGGGGGGGGTPPGAPVPEPATMLLFGSGAVGLGYYRRKKAAAQVEEAPAE
ncbi:MAG: PEP-CTERM sorting domain-containing protein [Planctomycetota bacterium]